MNHTKDTWKIGNHEFTSRFILGSGKYSLDLIKAAVEQAKAQIITLALRRVNEGGAANILDYIPQGVSLLPNTSGARDTILMNCFSRSSLATGPKIRVPLGVLSSLIMTAAFSSNLI